jgi:hypothetical protein
MPWMLWSRYRSTILSGASREPVVMRPEARRLVDAGAQAVSLRFFTQAWSRKERWPRSDTGSRSNRSGPAAFSTKFMNWLRRGNALSSSPTSRAWLRLVSMSRGTNPSTIPQLRLWRPLLISWSSTVCLSQAHATIRQTWSCLWIGVYLALLTSSRPKLLIGKLGGDNGESRNGRVATDPVSLAKWLRRHLERLLIAVSRPKAALPLPANPGRAGRG